MLSSLTTYLASLPPGQTTALTVLGAVSPGFFMLLGGFAWAHVSAVRVGR